MRLMQDLLPQSLLMVVTAQRWQSMESSAAGVEVVGSLQAEPHMPVLALGLLIPRSNTGCGRHLIEQVQQVHVMYL
jgi:hypothetical protein